VLFDGKSLGSWAPTEFGGQGEVHVANQRLILEMGFPLTGVTWQGTWPAAWAAYELELLAARLDGNDFFCGLTFPVPGGTRHLTLVLGGWGGGVCGLSSLDGDDAAHNATCRVVAFTNGREYVVRLAVSERRVRAWLDGELLVDQNLDGRELSLRPEVLLSRPLGVAAFTGRAAFGPIRVRPVGSAER
jgi:hypothetical protein